MQWLSKLIDLVVDLAGRALNSPPPKPLPPKTPARRPPPLLSKREQDEDFARRLREK
jgi:hypothetical protein